MRRVIRAALPEDELQAHLGCRRWHSGLVVRPFGGCRADGDAHDSFDGVNRLVAEEERDHLADVWLVLALQADCQPCARISEHLGAARISIERMSRL